MRTFGLIGKPLTHSFSKKYFSEKFRKENISDASYLLYPLKEIEELRPLIAGTPSLKGLNVTIPFKKEVVSLMDFMDDSALEANAVNCIKIERHDKGKTVLKGYNTDIYGFRQSIKPFLESHHEKALILGTGGGSGAVSAVLKKIGIECFFVSRNKSGSEKEHLLSYNEINENVIDTCKLIINTTPLGMYPDTEKFPPIPYGFLTSSHLLYDLVYNPEETKFLKFGKEKGSAVLNGLSMLHLQAEKSWEIWNEK